MEVFFLPATPGQRLCTYHPPTLGRARGAVVYVHPWAEEMNKSRRMAALQSRALADAGYAVLRIDLHGCGDSSGDFADASWHGWVDDVILAARWLQQRHAAPLCFWGLRAGALLATQAAQQMGAACNLLLWQPAVAGKQLLQQFLRLRATAELGHGDSKGILQRVRDDLKDGRGVDVAGYRLPPSLAFGLEQARLQLPEHAGHVAWLELSTREGATLLPASATQLQAWRASGQAVSAQVVAGSAFWQTQEIEDAPALIAATLAALRLMLPADIT